MRRSAPNPSFLSRQQTFFHQTPTDSLRKSAPCTSLHHTHLPFRLRLAVARPTISLQLKRTTIACRSRSSFPMQKQSAFLFKFSGRPPISSLDEFKLSEHDFSHQRAGNNSSSNSYSCVSLLPCTPGNLTARPLTRVSKADIDYNKKTVVTSIIGRSITDIHVPPSDSFLSAGRLGAPVLARPVVCRGGDGG